MKPPGQWFPPEATLGFVIGILFCLALAGPLSYQASYCAETQPQHHKNEPPAKHVETPSAHQGSDSGHAQQSESDKASPIICTPLSLFAAAVGFMDQHEGAVVGFLTALLVGATTLLWYSTNKLWSAGKDQFELARKEFISTHRPKLIVRDVHLVYGVDRRPLDGLIRMQFELSNVGDSHATVVAARMAAGFVTNTTLQEEPLPRVGQFSPPFWERFSLPAGALRVMFFPTGARFELEHGITLPLGEGLFFQGHILYEDENEVVRRTSFCRRYQPDLGYWPRSPYYDRDHAD